MKEAVERAIEALVKKAVCAEKAIDAQQYAQAALNLGQVLYAISDTEKIEVPEVANIK